MSARVELTYEDEMVLARITGEVDAAGADAVGEEVLGAATTDFVSLVMDLSGVRYLDSAGVRMLFELAARLEVARQQLTVVVPAESPLRRLIDMTNVASVAAVVADVRDAFQGAGD